MKNIFIMTESVTRCTDLCNELAEPEGMIGPSLGMITGQAGRGKTEFAKHYATNSTAVYLPPLNIRTPTMLLREIAFELCKVRPGRSEACLSVIGEEMAKERRLVIIDEADLLSMDVLEMLRNMNERFNCPVILIGEDNLKGKIVGRRRIASRIRRHLAFAAVEQADIVLFFRKAVEMNVGPDQASMIQNKAKGDWRPVLTIALGIERAMRASGLDGSAGITTEALKEIINGCS